MRLLAAQVKQVARDLSQDFALKPTQAAARAKLGRGEVPAAARQVSANSPPCWDAASSQNGAFRCDLQY